MKSITAKFAIFSLLSIHAIFFSSASAQGGRADTDSVGKIVQVSNPKRAAD